MTGHRQNCLCNLTFSENPPWDRCGNTIEVEETAFEFMLEKFLRQVEHFPQEFFFVNH